MTTNAMTTNLKPRIENIDVDWAIALRDDTARDRTLPVAPSQIDYYVYADQCFDLAALEYALGAPLELLR